jgi:hypothetical protein
VDLLGNTGAMDRLAALVDQDRIGAPGVTPTGNATFAAERTPWWFIGARVVPAGASAVVGALHPLLGAIIALVAMSVALMIIGTAMFGSPKLSKRAFRLIGNRPEPRNPSGEFAGSKGAQDLAIPPVSTLSTM